MICATAKNTAAKGGICDSSSSRCRRQRGKRSGVRVRLGAYLLLAIYYCYRWLKLVIPEAGCPLPCCRPGRIFSRAFVQNHLRLVGHVSHQSDLYLIHMALINTRSLTNKTHPEQFLHFPLPGFSPVDGNMD